MWIDKLFHAFVLLLIVGAALFLARIPGVGLLLLAVGGGMVAVGALTLAAEYIVGFVVNLSRVREPEESKVILGGELAWR